ncbi:unnamed protein product, partial [Polarella glacialis]
AVVVDRGTADGQTVARELKGQEVANAAWGLSAPGIRGDAAMGAPAEAGLAKVEGLIAADMTMAARGSAVAGLPAKASMASVPQAALQKVSTFGPQDLANLARQPTRQQCNGIPPSKALWAVARGKFTFAFCARHVTGTMDGVIHYEFIVVKVARDAVRKRKPAASTSPADAAEPRVLVTQSADYKHAQVGNSPKTEKPLGAEQLAAEDVTGVEKLTQFLRAQMLLSSPSRPNGRRETLTGPDISGVREDALLRATTTPMPAAHAEDIASQRRNAETGLHEVKPQLRRAKSHKPLRKAKTKQLDERGESHSGIICDLIERQKASLGKRKTNTTVWFLKLLESSPQFFFGKRLEEAKGMFFRDQLTCDLMGSIVSERKEHGVWPKTTISDFVKQARSVIEMKRGYQVIKVEVNNWDIVNNLAKLRTNNFGLLEAPERVRERQERMDEFWGVFHDRARNDRPVEEEAEAEGDGDVQYIDTQPHEPGALAQFRALREAAPLSVTHGSGNFWTKSFGSSTGARTGIAPLVPLPSPSRPYSSPSRPSSSLGKRPGSGSVSRSGSSWSSARPAVQRTSSLPSLGRPKAIATVRSDMAPLASQELTDQDVWGSTLESMEAAQASSKTSGVSLQQWIDVRKHRPESGGGHRPDSGLSGIQTASRPGTASGLRTAAGRPDTTSQYGGSLGFRATMHLTPLARPQSGNRTAASRRRYLK